MLPIGSIVYLKEGTSKLMILNCAPILPAEGKEQKGIILSVTAICLEKRNPRGEKRGIDEQ